MKNFPFPNSEYTLYMEQINCTRLGSIIVRAIDLSASESIGNHLARVKDLSFGGGWSNTGLLVEI